MSGNHGVAVDAAEGDARLGQHRRARGHVRLRRAEEQGHFQVHFRDRNDAEFFVGQAVIGQLELRQLVGAPAVQLVLLEKIELPIIELHILV